MKLDKILKELIVETDSELFLVGGAPWALVQLNRIFQPKRRYSSVYLGC